MSPDPSFPILASRLSALVRADGDLSQGAKVTFDAIVMVAKWAQGRTGFCFPSYERLGQIVGRKVRMIGNYLRELRERGYLTWARKQRAPNVYALNLGLVSADPPAAPALPEGWRAVTAGYKFAGGKFQLPGVRELVRGAAAVRAGLSQIVQAAPSALPRRSDPGHGVVVGDRVYGMRRL